jgi:uncharacterized RDD family membrane protein YckC
MPPPGPPQPPPYPRSGIPGGNLPGFGYQQQGPMTGPPVYGGFWIRFLAVLIDMLIIGFVFGFPLRFVGTDSEVVGIIVGIVAGVIYFAAYITYFILMTGWRGQTLGKMALRLKVVNADMTPVDYGTAAIREFSKLLSALILYIGYIMAGFDSEKRALHDRIAKTRVIRY